MIPVCVLTGFLGSGKTTLLARMLKSPAFARTAVIINEFGEIGLDHDLIETGTESFVELSTGCLCCTVRGDLVRTLDDIVRRRDEGRVAPFERVVIETSGLADPAPILHALISDHALAERLTLAGVVATVDALNGADTLDRQHESVKQVALADRLIITKTDLIDGPAHTLAARLAALNPIAKVTAASFGEIDPACLFERAPDRLEHVPAIAAQAHRHPTNGAETHDAAISCFALVRSEPIAAIALTLFLEILAEHCGADLLRLKGIVAIAESPERPAVIHGVQHVFHPPAFLPRWPSADRTTRLIVIGRRIPRPFVETLLAAVMAEVGETTAARR